MKNENALFRLRSGLRASLRWDSDYALPGDEDLEKGGPGSGHHEHSGRPGVRGGSLPATVGHTDPNVGDHPTATEFKLDPEEVHGLIDQQQGIGGGRKSSNPLRWLSGDRHLDLDYYITRTGRHTKAYEAIGDSDTGRKIKERLLRFTAVRFKREMEKHHANYEGFTNGSAYSKTPEFENIYKNVGQMMGMHAAALQKAQKAPAGSKERLIALHEAQAIEIVARRTNGVRQDLFTRGVVGKETRTFSEGKKVQYSQFFTPSGVVRSAALASLPEAQRANVMMSAAADAVAENHYLNVSNARNKGAAPQERRPMLPEGAPDHAVWANRSAGAYHRMKLDAMGKIKESQVGSGRQRRLAHAVVYFARQERRMGRIRDGFLRDAGMSPERLRNSEPPSA